MKTIIRNLLSNLNNGFAENELAYLGLQSKYEGQIRDKFAWRLQCDLDSIYGTGKYMVRREWPSLVDTKKITYNGSGLRVRNKVDIAILELDQKTTEVSAVKVLIEFKVHMFLNQEQWPYEEFYMDVKKMHDLSDLIQKSGNFGSTEPDLYFIFLHGSPDSRCKNYASAVQYSDILNSKTRKGMYHCTLYLGTNAQSFIYEMQKFWNKFFDTNFTFGQRHMVQPLQNIPRPVSQYLGESFGYKLYCAPMIWGPVKASNLTI